ncbi:MAG: HD domain-containing protein [Deltaproteobacteria bacterium]|nr:MAG: HD domain-containing protein [Deltaproteobacteria bacterium]
MSLPPESEIAAFAIRAHGGQRYGERPYLAHLMTVAENLRRYGIDDPELIAAAWLHDTVEDTDVSVSQIASAYGERVAAVVSAVTTSTEGATRKERMATTYPRIAATPGAVLVKLADRIANVEACWRSWDARLFKYRDEYPGFRSALKVEGEGDAMWDHLDKLLAYRSA